MTGNSSSVTEEERVARKQIKLEREQRKMEKHRAKMERLAEADIHNSHLSTQLKDEERSSAASSPAGWDGKPDYLQMIGTQEILNNMSPGKSPLRKMDVVNVTASKIKNGTLVPDHSHDDVNNDVFQRRFSTDSNSSNASKRFKMDLN